MTNTASSRGRRGGLGGVRGGGRGRNLNEPAAAAAAAAAASSAFALFPSDRRTSNPNSPNYHQNLHQHQHQQHHEINGNGQVADDKFEVPLPFGYHMDLDFVRFCSEDLSSTSGGGTLSGETLSRLKDLRRERRRQRKTLEALMGIRAEQQQQQQQHNAKKLTAATLITIPRPKTISSSIRRAATGAALPPPDVVSSQFFASDALRDAVTDFEEHLERTREDERERAETARRGPLSSSTFRGGQNSKPLFRHLSNSSISSVSTVSSPVYEQRDFVEPATRGQNAEEEDEETESVASITSNMSAGALRSVREQMAKSLAKLREQERAAAAVPVLQARLAVMKEERRMLVLQLRQREFQMRRMEGGGGEEEDVVGVGEYYDTDGEEEDFEGGEGAVSGGGGLRRYPYLSDARARSESPFSRGMVNPDEFISVQKTRRCSSAAAGGYNSDSDLITSGPYGGGGGGRRKRLGDRELGGGFGRMAKSKAHYNLSTPHFDKVQLKQQQHLPKAVTKESGMMTDPVPEPPPRIIEVPAPKRSPSPPKLSPVIYKRDKGSNTDPPPRSPPPPRKISHGTNTTGVRTVARSSGPSMPTGELFTKEQLESRIQEAVFKTEDEIMGCPLLQKAMKKVEEEAIHGPTDKSTSGGAGVDASCQVGEENLRPFVIDVGLLCKLDDTQPIVVEKEVESEDDRAWNSSSGRLRKTSFNPQEEKLVRSIGVGDFKLVEEPSGPTKFRDAAICTEKWVEVIKASKQTDTEDFAFKDTESPRVADLFRFEPSPERVVMERRSSLRRTAAGSPVASRKSSTSSPGPSRKSSAFSTPKAITRTQGTMTQDAAKRDAKVGTVASSTKTVATSALALPGLLQLPAPGSPLVTPEREKPPVTVCDKCTSTIQEVAQGVLGAKAVQPPSPDMPWLSKIPRPVENPNVQKLKNASSIGDISQDNRMSSTTSSLSMQRSKSTLTSSQTRRLSSPKSPVSFGGTRRDSFPHYAPKTPPLGASASGVAVRRVSSPLARSQSPHAPVVRRLNTSGGARTPELSKSLIPRVVTPPALRKMFPRGGADKLAAPNRNVVRKTTFTKSAVGLSRDLSGGSQKSVASSSAAAEEDNRDKATGSDTDSVSEDDSKKGVSSKGFPLPGAALFAPIDANRKKVEPSKEMRAALKVLSDSLNKGSSAQSSSGGRGNAQVTNAVNIIQQEWFKVSGTKQSNPLDVEDYLDAIDLMTKGSELLARVVNMTDVNGNTALHYSVSHGNFDVVSVLVDSKVANPNVLNKAGYTCTMLVSLAALAADAHRAVAARLFSLGDVNLRATQHGQTALMLAASHGRLDMVELLSAAGADVNVRDEDGSTALMCAAEHGHMDIVKFLLQQPETNVLAKDNDGLTALAVAMEAGHRDVGVVLYANMSFSRGSSPYSSARMKKTPVSSRTSTPTNVMSRSMEGGGGARTKSPMQQQQHGPMPPLRRRNSNL